MCAGAAAIMAERDEDAELFGSGDEELSHSGTPLALRTPSPQLDSDDHLDESYLINVDSDNEESKVLSDHGDDVDEANNLD